MQGAPVLSGSALFFFCTFFCSGLNFSTIIDVTVLSIKISLLLRFTFLAQFKWTYVDDVGKHFNVGLFHGAKTGHLMVYCNGKVVVIDFHVLKTKTYTFFIEDELCNLTVERKEDQWYYGLEIDQETETPRNIIRKKMLRENLITSIIIMAILILTISAVSIFLTIFSQ